MLKPHWEKIWNELCDELRVCGREILDASPEDDLIQAEGLRYVARLFRYAVGRQLDFHPAGKPRLNYESVRIGGDNPDYRYITAPLDGRLTYRLRGRMNGARRIGFGTYSGGLGTSEGMKCTGYLDSAVLPPDGDGTFEIDLSQNRSERPWLALSDKTNALIIRETILDRDADAAAEYTLSCIDEAPVEPMDAAAIQRGFARTMQFVPGTIRQFLQWTAYFDKHPNEILPLPAAFLAAAQGDKSTRYFNGSFSLPDREHALVISFTPPACDYWNFQICNHWLESIEPIRTPTSYNNATAHHLADGSVRFVIAASDPETTDWLDTVGHLRGGIAMRHVGLHQDAEPTLPRCELVPIAHLKAQP